MNLSSKCSCLISFSKRYVHSTHTVASASLSSRSNYSSSKKPPTENESNTTEELTEDRNVWRKPFHEREGEWYSAFSLFAPKKGNSPDLIRFLQTPIDLRPSKIRSWYLRKVEETKIHNQRYITERHEILGNDLATAHFVVHRGGSVKFVGHKHWIKKDDEDQYSLPRVYSPEFMVEAIDAHNMELYYEGFVNMVNLRKLKWLSLRGCPNIDDWCVDRISGEYQSTLEHLDLSDCHQVTERALSAMYRMKKLKVLKLNNIVKSKSFELSCLMLEDAIPNLRIEGVTYIDPPQEKST